MKNKNMWLIAAILLATQLQANSQNRICILSEKKMNWVDTIRILCVDNVKFFKENSTTLQIKYPNISESVCVCPTENKKKEPYEK